MAVFSKVLNIFCLISTGIFLCSGIYCFICWGPDVQLSLSYILGVFLISFFSSVFYIPFFSGREFSKAALLFFRAVYFLVVNLMVLAVGYKLGWFKIGNGKMIIGMEITVAAVFLIVHVVEYIRGLQEAKKMNVRIASRNSLSE
ncbi:DUF3021 family protein [Treponema sp.]|uniref:DUF3021 family protein n=1 Tax=Treponema sp. TaxID=166 RepID=UPI003EFD49BB